LPPWAGARVAIVHDWFQGYHGSERVVEALACDVLAEAARVDIFTFHAARELLPERLSSRIVRESRLARLPGIRQVGHEPGRWRYLLPYMPRFFRSLPLAGYDLVISSSHACALHAAPPGRVPYVCYCHTPMRYAWLPDAESGRASGVRAAGLRLVVGRLRDAERRAAARPDLFIANSSVVRERIRRFYGREATVVHPAVRTDELSPGEKEPKRFLWVGRLVAYKRPQLVVEAFRGLDHARLTMVGIGPLEPSVRARLPANVELVGWLSRERLAGLYARASGFLCTAEEDFGISMVEALATGTPVVALGAGGARDIVRDGVDGILVREPTAAAFRAAIEEAIERRWDEAGLVARSREFSAEAFAANMRRLLASVMAPQARENDHAG
jgi:glycosyltransferase involved in cell wall biosynthesis